VIDPEVIRASILAALPGSTVDVKDTTGTGDHFEALVVSPAFAGKSMIEQQRAVYAPLNAWLKTGELHALALKTYSPEQWAKVTK
jgi:acid stress-induced BolA-like protein IbaG/YrbA